MPSVNVIVPGKKIDCDHLLGTYLDESHFDFLIDSDTDIYLTPECDPVAKLTCTGSCSECTTGKNEERIALKFRKGWFNDQEKHDAYIGLRNAAAASQNRGLAAGPKAAKLQGREWVTDYQYEILEYLMDESNKLFDDTNVASIRRKYSDKDTNDTTRGHVWLRSEVIKVYPEYSGWFDRWVDSISNFPKSGQATAAKEIVNGWISTTTYANPSMSGIAGWYDRYPRIPFGRATSYTRDNFSDFEKAFPFLQSLNRGFKELAPTLWKNQNEAASKIDSRFLVPGTVFTTITVNKNFRTAAHRDAGDLNTGMSNLLVVGDGRYTGGYLVIPEYRVAVNVRPGDMLLINNHELIHGNTPIEKETEESERISLVCYFREGMLDLKSMEYELLREKFVETRKNNSKHPLWRPLWNGVSKDMWKSDEWKEFIIANGMKDEDGLIDVDRLSLESFFE